MYNGDEIATGLDPNNPTTLGVPDAEYKLEQTISADSEALSEINSEEAPYELSLEISASGYAGKNLIAESSMFSSVTDSNARVGEIVDLSYVGGEVDKVKLIYEIKDDFISNDGSEYAENCLDLQGIKRYNIFRYFENINMLLPVATQFDEENNTLYAETDELGTYCLLDMEVLMQNLNIFPDGIVLEAINQPTFFAAPVTEAEEPVSDEYCITFILDIRKGKITTEQLDRIKGEVRSFADEAFAFNPNTAIRLLTQDVSDFDDESFKIVCEGAETLDELNTALDKIKVSRNDGVFGNYCIISEALLYAADNSDASVNNYVFDIYNQTDAIFENNIADNLFEEIKSRNINISIISPEAETITGYQKMLSDSTGGIIIDKSEDIAYKRLYQHVYDKKVLDQSFSAILITGYQPIELKGKLSAYNNIDTDDDTLTDWDEVGVEHWIENGLITYDSSGNIMLPTIEQCMRFVVCSYVEDGLERFQSDYGINFGAAIASARVLPIISDPTYEDGDYDGICDKLDFFPLNNSFEGQLKNDIGTYKVNFNVDYSVFFSDNEQYNKKLAVLGSIYAILAYKGPMLDLRSCINIKYSDLAVLFNKFGLDEVKDINLANEFQDDDISEMIIGHREVTYNSIQKDIIVVSVRGTDSTIEEWSSNFDVGADTSAYWDRDNLYWRNKLNHKGFDVAANRLYDRIISYIDEYANDDIQKTIYIVGHSRGAAIANILGSLFENKEDIDTFVYTFATPNTTTADKNIRESYNTIFNIVNEDDLVTYLPLKKWEFDKYGHTYSASITECYENKLSGLRWYHWEYLFNTDYNYNENLDNTIDALNKIANNRNELYEYTDDRDTIYTYKDSNYTNGELDVQDRINKYGERIAKYCQVSAISKGFYPVNGTYEPEIEVFDIEVRQSPAFLMMVLADLASSDCHIREDDHDKIVKYKKNSSINEESIFINSLGFYVAPAYKNAKINFVYSALDIVVKGIFIGGMFHAHTPDTYYFSANDYLNELKLKL